jgi:hypothetical protein
MSNRYLNTCHGTHQLLRQVGSNANAHSQWNQQQSTIHRSRTNSPFECALKAAVRVEAAKAKMTGTLLLLSMCESGLSEVPMLKTESER